ncbi:EamA family transporter [Gloeocapsopsis dulcis]|uniref:EamA family transporter n=1 Tax=Gloeocapsopsis dulcis AAB1 = 1H9 TaxID=1433147 RepID=A0A6N8G586_9CHRO|nr:EamA family transporter [Gloeocapsopsis dulcis]MUL39197.1 EamA family transporter [Gloeocapsopsis dulcis AAB1 = 1H9]WNN90761.1 EamA family transporter [Gloeocapsopsis dulcis]
MKTLRVVLSYTAAAPPHIWFVISAIFHYLGPSFAVLLFQYVGVLGVAWFRIASAAMIFAIWTRPWKSFRSANREVLILLWLLGACLALMNSTFYLAIDRLPLSLVAAIEFVGTIAIALFGLRSVHNYIALSLAAIGAFILTGIHWSSDPLGLTYAIINGLLFMSYIVLGHRIARQGAGEGVGRLGAAMAAAFIVVMPIGFSQAVAALPYPTLILAGIGVGVCSSVIPYVCDQLAMSRIPRNTFALMLALLPATATIVGAIVLGQIPTLKDAIGILLVMVGVAIHKPARVDG